MYILRLYSLFCGITNNSYIESLFKFAMISLSAVLILCSLSIGFVNGANILAVFPGPLASHVKGFTPYLIELAKRGHNVTVYSVFPPKNIPPNYNHVAVENVFQKIDFTKTGLAVWPPGYGTHFANKGNTKSFQFDEFALHPDISFINGNPISCSCVTDIRTKLPTNMNMMERFLNCVFVLLDLLGHYWYYLPKQQEFADKYIRYEGSESRPPLRDLLANASLTLIHSDQILFQSRPYIPSFIEVSGFHMTEPEGLPQDLQKIMDDSKEGVIYFSLGSWVNPSYFSPEKQKAIVETFSRLPQTILWKGDENITLSKNIVVRKWFPQIDILAHPNIKLFVTHGGIHSLLETVYYGVPILGIPLMFDQDTNVNSAVDKGYGRYVNRKKFTTESLLADISELLNNSKYREKALELSAAFRDRPLSPMDTAIYWTEYVLRHKGTPHLQTPAKHLHWFQLYLLDLLITFIFLLCFMYCFIYLIYIFIKKLYNIKSKRTFKIE